MNQISKFCEKYCKLENKKITVIMCLLMKLQGDSKS